MLPHQRKNLWIYFPNNMFRSSCFKLVDRSMFQTDATSNQTLQGWIRLRQVETSGHMAGSVAHSMSSEPESDQTVKNCVLHSSFHFIHSILLHSTLECSCTGHDVSIR